MYSYDAPEWQQYLLSSAVIEVTVAINWNVAAYEYHSSLYKIFTKLYL